MPMPIISVPQFPAVPMLAGVPQLVRLALNTPPNPVPSLAAQTPQQQAVMWTASQVKPVWGIYNAAGTTQVVFPDNVYALDYADEWSVPDFPTQNGGFASYNKVTLPFDLSVRLTKGGSLTERQQFLASINRIVGDTNLYTILTPEQAYSSCNIRRREMIRRSSEGAFFLEVDIYFRQIIEVTAQYSSTAANTSNAQNPAAIPSVSLGNVQPSTSVPAAASAAGATVIANTPN